MQIEDRVRQILETIPPHVHLVAAAKTRSPDEIRTVLEGGVTIVGQNYVQEAKRAIDVLGRDTATWHLIGHLQRNKAREAVRLFDMIQSVDSARLAVKLDSEAKKAGRVLPVLIEVNSAREPDKTGVLPEEVPDLVSEAARLPSIRVEGLMTMGPLTADPEAIRPFFRATKELFDRLAADPTLPASMRTLSMGMTDSYAVAIEEGSTMIRLGTALFGPRTCAI